MRKSSCLAVALFVFAFARFASAQATAAPPTVFVSNFSGHQILKVNVTNKTLQAVYTGNSSFSPEDLVIGPDGKLYICDSLNSVIWRADPTQNPLQPSVIVTFPRGVYPEGPSFSGSFDLYVNTRGGGNKFAGKNDGADGVWVIYDIADPQNVLASYTPTPIINSLGNKASGEGTTLGAFGNLMMVDQANNKVLNANWNGVDAFGTASVPNFGPTFTQLVPWSGQTVPLSAPVAITTSTCGTFSTSSPGQASQDILVASGTTVQRFVLLKDTNPNDKTFGQWSVTSQNTYVDFTSTGDVVAYMERDAGNNLYVATNNNSTGGKIWQVTPNGNPMAACLDNPNASGTATQLVALGSIAQNSAQAQAVGLAITPTNWPSDTAPSNITAPTAMQFSPLHPSNTYNFGHYTATITYKQVLTTFTQAWTALMTPAVQLSGVSSGQPYISFTSTFPNGTVPMLWPSFGGNAIQLFTASPPAGCGSFAQCGVPISGFDYAASTGPSDPAYTVTLAFHDPVKGFHNPGLAHSTSDALTASYGDLVTHDFWQLFDQAIRGGGYNTEYVAFDAPLSNTVVQPQQLPLVVTLNQPALSGNPQFNYGQNFTVSITVTDQQGHTVPGLHLRLSAALIQSSTQFVGQTIVSTKNSAVDNILNDNGNGKYSYNVDTSFFSPQAIPGNFQFTIFGDGFAPYFFTAVFSATNNSNK